MLCLRQLAIAAPVLLALTPACAQEAARPSPPGGPHPAAACLDQKQRRAAIESGQVVHLVTALRAAKKRIQGTLIRALLCRRSNGLVYELTVLARDGKVVRLTIDAVKGTVVGER